MNHWSISGLKCRNGKQILWKRGRTKEDRKKSCLKTQVLGEMNKASEKVLGKLPNYLFDINSPSGDSVEAIISGNFTSIALA